MQAFCIKIRSQADKENQSVFPEKKHRESLLRKIRDERTKQRKMFPDGEHGARIGQKE
jgi:hypothetical protein